MAGAIACPLHSTLCSDMRRGRVFTLCVGLCLLLVTSLASVEHYLLKEILCYPWPCSISDCQQEQVKWGEDGAGVLCSSVGGPEAVVSQCEVPGCQTGLNLEFRTLRSSK